MPWAQVIYTDRMRKSLACVGALALLASAAPGCDPSAKTSQGAELGGGDRQSQLLETCSRTADCAPELRCFSGACRPIKASTLGDFYAQAGERALQAGHPRDAAESYAAAVSTYEKDKVPAPPEILCGQGRALLAEPGIAPQRAELAARVLHKCLLGAPVGSALRQTALAQLARLIDLGLDPQLVARSKPADLYLTRPPRAPALDSLTLAVKVDSHSRSSSFKKVVKFLEESPEVRSALSPCWKAHWDKTHKDTLQVSLPLHFGFELDANDDFDHAYVKIPDAAPPSDPQVAADTQCAAAAVGPLVDAEGRKTGDDVRWDALASFTMAPPAAHGSH